MFTPDVESLIRPIRIEKPQEEFVLPGEETPLPEAASDAPAGTPSVLAPAPTPLQALLDEAGRVQDLIDMLVETTPAITVSIPQEDQPLLGTTTVSTQDYVADATDPSPDAIRRRGHFEWGLLQGCGGEASPYWPIVALPDLQQLQADLLDAAGVVNGTLLAQTALAPPSSPAWQADAGASHLTAVHDALVQSSRDYRLKLAQATFTLRTDATSDLLRKLVEPLLLTELDRMRSTLMAVMNGMKALRNLLCHAQFLRAMEYRSVRDALLATFEAALLKQLLNALLVLLGKAETALIRPVLDMLENGLGNGPILAVLGDAAGQEIASVAGAAMLSLQKRYNDQAADLIRAVDQRRDQQLRKLQTLGERNQINRWVAHLDAGILTLRGALSQTTIFSRELAQQLASQVLRPLDPPASPLLDRLQAHPELSTVLNSPLTSRDVAPRFGLGGPIRLSFGDLQLADPTAAFPSTPSFTGVGPDGQPREFAP